MSNSNSDSKVIYPELSYLVCGVLYRIQRELGSGYQEKHVQRAVAAALSSIKLNFREQVMSVMKFDGKAIGRYFLDFVIDDKIVIELKIGDRLKKQDFDQIKQYLAKTGLKLGLLARFGRNGVTIHRVLKPL